MKPRPLTTGHPSPSRYWPASGPRSTRFSRQPEKLADARVDLRTGVPAQRLDVATTTVTLADGNVVEGTHVVIATGARARRLPWYEPAMYELRNLADARRLMAHLDVLSAGDVVAIVGGGFIGAEVATAVKAVVCIPSSSKQWCVR